MLSSVKDCCKKRILSVFAAFNLYADTNAFCKMTLVLEYPDQDLNSENV